MPSRIFGVSLWTIFIVLAALVVGAKNPGLVARIPLVGKL